MNLPRLPIRIKNKNSSQANQANQLNQPSIEDYQQITTPPSPREGLRVLTLGDPHFKTGNVEETNLLIDRFLDLASRLEPDLIVILGDTLDNFSTADVSPRKRAYRLCSNLKRIAPTILLVGNHDRPSNTDYLTDNHHFNDLKEWGPRMTVVERPLIQVHQGLKILFAPYVEPGKLIQSFEDSGLTDWVSVDMVFSHQEFAGCHMGKIISQNGDYWDPNNPLDINGHIHSYQKLADNLICTGTSMGQRYGEGRDKSVSYYIFYGDPQQRPGTTQVKGIEYQERRISLNLPYKLKEIITFEELATYQPPHDARVKLVVRCNLEQYRCCLSLQRVKELEPQGVLVVRKLTEIPQRQNRELNPHFSLAKKNFGQVLYEEASTDPQLKQRFEQLFGDKVSLLV